jgi:hypothetical protein
LLFLIFTSLFFVLRPVYNLGYSDVHIFEQTGQEMINKDKKNFFYNLRTFCEITLQEAGELVPVDKSCIYQYETEGVQLHPLRYLIVLKKESGLSWETVGELMEKWNEERPLRKRPKTNQLASTVEE